MSCAGPGRSRSPSPRNRTRSRKPAAFACRVLAREPRAWGEAVLAVALASACAWAAEQLFPVASLSVIYMTAVVVVASRRGLGPALAAAVLGFLAYNFLFTDPRYTFHVSRQGELLTLGLFLVASLITGNLAARLRARIDAQAAIADRTNKLYDFSRRVAAAATADDVVWASVSHVATTLRCEAVLLMPRGAELRVVGGFPPEDRLDVRDQSAAQFAWEKGEARGPWIGHAADGALVLPAAGRGRAAAGRPRHRLCR